MDLVLQPASSVVLVATALVAKIVPWVGTGMNCLTSPVVYCASLGTPPPDRVRQVATGATRALMEIDRGNVWRAPLVTFKKLKQTRTVINANRRHCSSTYGRNVSVVVLGSMAVRRVQVFAIDASVEDIKTPREVCNANHAQSILFLKK